MLASLPELDQAWHLLSQQRFAEATRQAAAVLARFPDNVSALACHAMASWKADGDIAESLAEIQRAVALAPGEASIRHNLATLHASAGDIEAAAEQFEAALAIKPDDTLAFYGLTQNRRFGAESDLVRAMVALDADPGLDQTRREFLNFALAKVYDDLGLPERAMAHAMVANRLGARPFDLGAEGRALDQLRDLAALDAFRRARDSGHPSTVPLFIVGMPRSGTTLVEAILARHPDVFALGESSLMAELEYVGFSRIANSRRDGGRHEMMLGLDRDWLRANAETWLSYVTTRARRPFRIVTDKLPENAVRLGLIRRFFPHARVVHVRRHPLDTGVSNFFQRFSAGQGFSTRLDWIGVRSRQVADSMAIWKTALDMPILDIQYEKLVTHPETEARRLVAFAGLDWTDACLRPDQAGRSVLTASHWQVRQPINTHSIGRWRRYEQWLAPMIEAMGGHAWIDAQMTA
jgi:hypothetical protein